MCLKQAQSLAQQLIFLPLVFSVGQHHMGGLLVVIFIKSNRILDPWLVNANI
jgi:hypothetical protein